MSIAAAALANCTNSPLAVASTGSARVAAIASPARSPRVIRSRTLRSCAISVGV